MKTKFIEANNWGKFMVAEFEPHEWKRCSVIDQRGLISGRGWTPEHWLIVDLQTGEGALFKPGGLAAADLNKHRIWVCPLFQPFLEWLYTKNVFDLKELPDHVDLPKAEFQFRGYRREGTPT